MLLITEGNFTFSITKSTLIWKAQLWQLAIHFYCVYCLDGVALANIMATPDGWEDEIVWN